MDQPAEDWLLTGDRPLVPNDDAERVQEIFRLRAENKSYRDIETVASTSSTRPWRRYFVLGCTSGRYCTKATGSQASTRHW